MESEHRKDKTANVSKIQVRRKCRRKNGFHIGGKVKSRNPMIEDYIYAKSEKRAIRNREKSMEQLVVVIKRIKERKSKGESVIVVGTTEELGPALEKLGESLDEEMKSRRILVTRTWISGRLTNYSNLQNTVQRYKGTSEERRTRSEKKWYKKHRKGREGYAGGKDGNAKLPGLIRFRHPNDHGVGRKEASRCGVPTVAVVNGESKYTDRVTYPLPGNTESRKSQRILIMRRKTLYTKETTTRRG